MASEPFHGTTVKRALETRLAEYRQECTESTKDDTTRLEKKPILFSLTLTMMPKEKRLAENVLQGNLSSLFCRQLLLPSLSLPVSQRRNHRVALSFPFSPELALSINEKKYVQENKSPSEEREKEGFVTEYETIQGKS